MNKLELSAHIYCALLNKNAIETDMDAHDIGLAIEAEIERFEAALKTMIFTGSAHAPIVIV